MQTTLAGGTLPCTAGEGEGLSAKGSPEADLSFAGEKPITVAIRCYARMLWVTYMLPSRQVPCTVGNGTVSSIPQTRRLRTTPQEVMEVRRAGWATLGGEMLEKSSCSSLLLPWTYRLPSTTGAL